MTRPIHLSCLLALALAPGAAAQPLALQEGIAPEPALRLSEPLEAVIDDLESYTPMNADLSFDFTRLKPVEGARRMSVGMSVKFEDVSDDPMRQDRLVAALTVTKKFGDITLPFGLVYANHTEFVTEVDEEISAGRVHRSLSP